MRLSTCFFQPLHAKSVMAIIASVSLVSLSGCGTAIIKMASTSIPSSKFMPTFTTEQEVDDYFNVVKSVSGKVVSDELGTYYHHESGGKIDLVFLAKDDGDALRNLLAGDVGLLEPTYSYDANGNLRPDWEFTQRRHDFLTKKVKLKLLPVSVTRKFHALVDGFASEEARRHSGTVAMTSAIFSGNYGLHNEKFANSVLDKIGDGFNYVIKDPASDSYFGEHKNNHLGAVASNQSAGAYQSKRWVMATIQSIEIVPRAYFENLTKGGIRFTSGCKSVTADSVKEIIRMSKETSDVPYLSGVSYAMKDKEAGNIARQRDLFVKDLLRVDARRTAAENACVAGLAALQVSGAIQSSRLK